ncbi:aquaporin-like isoform X1 [Pieris brassicae]|uniref:aquaporin-like isoform X1 n=2 Tax=Pieris brassicae TaxID=7116 RepID=UPI001E661516|nr:aquaporin-like isoform X1 [Pieris brassicae]
MSSHLKPCDVVQDLAGEYTAIGKKDNGVETWRILTSELVATAMLVFLSCLPACGESSPLLTRAVAAGLTVALLVQCFDHVSGAHMNPAISLAAVLSSRVSMARGVGMMVAQAIGSIAGALAAVMLNNGKSAYCVTMPNGVVWRAAAVEAVCTCCLTLANLSAWDIRNRRWHDSWPLRVGLAVSALTLAAGEISGASLNPLRSFAPALLSGHWDHHWIYWVGPLGGASGATALYVALWRLH